MEQMALPPIEITSEEENEANSDDASVVRRLGDSSCLEAAVTRAWHRADLPGEREKKEEID